MERYRAYVALTMGTIVVASALLQSSTIHGGTTVFNFEWYIFLSSLFLLGAAGYVIRMLLEEGPVIGGRKTEKKQLVRQVVTLLALMVAVYLLTHKKPEELTEGRGIGRSISGLWYNVTPSEFVVVWQQFPDWTYIIPLALFVILVVTAKRRRKRKYPFEVKFEPGMTYDSIEGTPAERVIKMYKNVVAGLVMKGYPYRESWTHWEHEERLKEIFPDLKDLDTLTRIFERAKYAGRLDERDVSLARESYERLMSFLR
ncbi:DUF4129 domain-containing protein [Thermococcus sp. M36]|uniref:DUF4129 domain-containing protein n=1 Tax=Thermococcus sp. M36 TaxID=1638261 RepID=UPI001F0DEA5E|nr:DUF4129 domain-containing protein [Thermococcus sp. M36]